MMKCKHIHELFSPYLDDMCNPRERAALEAHLNSCPACRQELEKMRRVCACLADIGDVPAPEGFAAQVGLRVRQEQAYTGVAEKTWRPGRVGTALGTVAAAAILVWLYVGGPAPSEPVSVADDPDVQGFIDKALEQLQQEQEPSDVEGPTIVIAPEPGEVDAPPVTAIAEGNDPAGEAPPVVEPAEERRIAQQYSTRIKIADSGAVIQSLFAIGENFGVVPVLAPAENALMSQQEDVAKTRLVYLTIAPENLDAVLAELNAMGFAAPTLTATDRTDELEDVVDALAQVDRMMPVEGQESNMSAEHRQALEAYQQQLLTQQAQVEQSVNQITIELFLLELKS